MTEGSRAELSFCLVGRPVGSDYRFAGSPGECQVYNQPYHECQMTMDEAVQDQLAEPELYEKRLSAEEAVTVYKVPYSGQSIFPF